MSNKNYEFERLVYFLLKKKVIEFLITEKEGYAEYPLGKIGPIKTNAEKLVKTKEGKETLEKLSREMAVLVSNLFPQVTLVAGAVGNKADALLTVFLSQKLARILGKKEIDYVLINSSVGAKEEIESLQLKEKNIILVRVFVGFEEDYFIHKQIHQLSGLGYNCKRVFCLMSNPVLNNYFTDWKVVVRPLINWPTLLGLAYKSHIGQVVEDVIDFIQDPVSWKKKIKKQDQFNNYEDLHRFFL